MPYLLQETAHRGAVQLLSQVSPALSEEEWQIAYQAFHRVLLASLLTYASLDRRRQLEPSRN